MLAKYAFQSLRIYRRASGAKKVREVERQVSGLPISPSTGHRSLTESMGAWVQILPPSLASCVTSVK